MAAMRDFDQLMLERGKDAPDLERVFEELLGTFECDDREIEEIADVWVVRFHDLFDRISDLQHFEGLSADEAEREAREQLMTRLVAQMVQLV